MKLYVLHTAATHEQVIDCAAWLVSKTGRAAVFDEMPDNYVVSAPRNTVWTANRWIAAVGVLSASPFVFRFVPHLSPLQGFGIGWITAAIILLLGRNSMSSPS